MPFKGGRLGRLEVYRVPELTNSYRNCMIEAFQAQISYEVVKEFFCFCFQIQKILRVARKLSEKFIAHFFLSLILLLS